MFISHASEDTNAVAFPLKAALEREGLRAWLDREALRLGESVAGKINAGLCAAKQNQSPVSSSTEIRAGAHHPALGTLLD